MNERVQYILKHKATIPAAVGVLSFGVGVAVGYFARKREGISLETYEQLKLDYLDYDPPYEFEELYKDEDERPEQPQDEEEDAAEVDVELEPDPSKMVRKNVFNDGPGEAPHVITEEDFFSSDLGYPKRVYTYFSGDDVMTDEEETPVYWYEKVLGPLSFGEGSNDPSTFFVRNHKTKSEYQIVKDEDSYSEMVLGIVEEDY